MPSEVSIAGADQDLGRVVEELKRELLNRSQELIEARELQAATAEILATISSSPTDLHRVFAEMAAAATRLCDGYNAGIFRLDGDRLRLVAHHGPIPVVGPVGDGALPLTRGLPPARAVLDRQTLHVADLQAETIEYPEGSDFARRLGFRAALSVPLLRAGEAIGVITIRRTDARPFTDRQIELLKTFADQAVIAIENARLFEAEQARTRELTDALDQQTATSQVLGVISTSPGNLEPVFQAMLANAVRLCAAKFGTLWLAEGGDSFRSAAIFDLPPALAEARRREPVVKFAPETGLGRVVKTKEVVHVRDMSQDPAYLAGNPRADLLVDLGGARTVMFAPMVKNNTVIGALTIYRQEVRPFTDKQIALVESFASQAVIAIENTRLLNELRESLQQQTATADVLKVISRSVFNLQLVLDTLVQSAAQLCEADIAVIRRPVGDAYPLAATYGLSSEQREHLQLYSNRPDRGSAYGRALIEGRTVHIPDVLADPEFNRPQAPGAIGVRTAVGVPLMREGTAIGVLILLRRQTRPFTQKQIELIETFADQAVIAIENTRLFEAEQASKRELQQSLEHQTATSDVLDVISRSPNTLQPVLDTIVATAQRLCRTDRGSVWTLHGDEYRLAASTENDEATVQYFLDNPILPSRGSLIGRVALENRTVHVPSVMDDTELTYPKDRPTITPATMLGVPLVRDGRVIGVIGLTRIVENPFTEKQIALIETFADQAVIAIENTRLFEAEQASKRELTEALQQQTATADVLGVISRSAFDLTPVFTSVAESAVRLCEADRAFIFRFDGELLQMAVGYNVSEEFEDWVRRNPIRPGRHSGSARAALERRTIHIPDVLADPEYSYGAKNVEAIRTILGVPILKGNDLLGVMMIFKLEVRPFSEKQIALIETFAEQAAIAIENARLFNEVQARTQELAKTVEDLEIASQHKSQFVANMSHELRTPLAAILGYAELMKEGFYEPLGQKSMDALTRILSNSKHLLGLINTVLDIAKIESGQFSLNIGEYAVESVVETVRVATESLAETKKLSLKTDVAKKLPVGLGDEQRLTQVLLNLVGNAIKFTDSGEVSITASAANNHFTVSVTDTGPGIPADQLTRVFEQFHQVDSSNTKAKGGTGLGLAIAKQIVEMHGGHIWAESSLGKGATFLMELPIRAPIKRALV